MKSTIGSPWHPRLTDPSDSREVKPRTSGLTMVIDKGLGPHAFQDLLTTSSGYFDLLKFGFGTSSLYPSPLLREKLAQAKNAGIAAFPGGTLLEAAFRLRVVPDFFRSVLELGFDGVEISDGTVHLKRSERDELIREAGLLGLRVFTEYGKKTHGARLDIDDLCRTFERDLNCGAELVTVEARESGQGVGLFDDDGACREDELELVLKRIPDRTKLMWEAPQKDQQAALLRIVGPDVNLGNVQPQEAFALETMRRGLRSDTFGLHRVISDYVI
ncbi:phosphosulfolactate synthase [Cohnella algarum]|uniref:phosphosulfolactate synthase n=1 Tax=Cohnella algarum TaxID=2044859 RepID=UPI001966E4B2|nr:phosphosulfolactate synthase [Cohnella algarum]MBN2984455.1 phosphosulfolactate synthase [Cohnella algarum]